MISLIMVSAVVTGMGVFYSDVTNTYNTTDSKFSDYTTKFNTYSTIDAKMKLIENSIRSINILNPLTWGNVAIFVVNIFTILFDIPLIFHNLVVNMFEMSGFIPSWTAIYVEAVILIIIIFSAIDSVRNS